MSSPKRPVQPVPPAAMEMIFFYTCPQCGWHAAVGNPTEAKLIPCESCGLRFPIIPVEEHYLHFMRIMTGAGRAAVAFLGRLKCQADRAAQAVAVLVQDFGDAQQVGRMAVVAAGVHDAGDEGRVRTVVLFRQR